jgi:hypothetical protein
MHFKLVQEFSKIAHFGELKELVNNSSFQTLEKGEIFDLHTQLKGSGYNIFLILQGTLWTI